MNRILVKALDSLCQRYGCRPSEVIGIKSEYERFDFDCSVMMMSEQTTNVETKEDEVSRLRQQFAYVAMLQQKVSPN